MDDDLQKRLWEQIHEIWIEPEVEKRRSKGLITYEFTIRECRILFPKDEPPKVEFNNEITWVMKAVRGDGLPFVPNETVYLRDLQKIENVNPPEIEGERVAFIFIFWNGLGWEILMDLSPNWPDNLLPPAEKEWRWGQAIAHHLQAHLMEKAIKVHDSAQNLLSKIGLWAVPTLLPYPLLNIIDRLKENDVAGANQILTNHCDNLFLENLSKDWWVIEAFNIRRTLIQEALQAHQLNLFHLSIHTLLPHVEGIITDWEYSLKSIQVPWREVSKAKKFRDIVLGDEDTLFTYQRFVESSSAFIINGPVLKDFTKWHDALDNSFPNRHATAHGKYESATYTKENSVKLFLLLDTISQIIIANNPLTKIDQETN